MIHHDRPNANLMASSQAKKSPTQDYPDIQDSDQPHPSWTKKWLALASHFQLMPRSIRAQLEAACVFTRFFISKSSGRNPLMLLTLMSELKRIWIFPELTFGRFCESMCMI